MIYKALHRKLKIELYKPDYKTKVNSGAPEGLTVTASLVAPIYSFSFIKKLSTLSRIR